MKKILGALILCVLALPLAAFNIPQGQQNSYYEPLLDLFSTGVNSGLAAATIPAKIFSAGFQANIAINTGGEILSQAGNTDNYFFPLLYVNLHISDFLIFGRGFAMKQHEVSTWYAGGGLGYIVSDYKLFFPQIRILGAFHILNSGSDDFKVSTATVNAVADYKIPILPIHALANIAYERNMMSTSWTDFRNVDFGVNRVRFSLGAMVSILFLNVSYEYTILPNPNHNLGLSVGF
ncbi:MAG: hypothetical protein LBC99_02150 [Spirochaetota bacterium]|jgi:hypothetical protein|nr:hypothetical protein [Spirochaetota bacterium]